MDYLDSCISASVGQVFLFGHFLFFCSPAKSAKWCRHTGGEVRTVTLGTTQPNNCVVKSYSAGSGQRFKSKSIFRHPPLWPIVSLQPQGAEASSPSYHHFRAYITIPQHGKIMHVAGVSLCVRVCVEDLRVLHFSFLRCIIADAGHFA